MVTVEVNASPRLSRSLLELRERALQLGNSSSVITDDPCAQQTTDVQLLAFRISAIFIVLVCSLLGVLITLQGKYWNLMRLHPFSITLAKTVGTGILFACSLVHLLQPSNQSLTSPCVPYAFNTTYQAYAYLYCMLAFLGMQFLQNYLGSIVRRRKYASLAPVGSSEKSCKDCANSIRPDIDIEAMEIAVNRVSEPASELTEEPVLKGNELGLIMHDSSERVAEKNLQQLSDVGTTADSQDISEQVTTVLSVQEALVAEFAFNVHSVIIGITTGLALNSQLTVLVIALSFHQFFEGVALGGRLFSAGFQGIYDLAFTLLFAFASPAGMAAGLRVLTTSSLNVNGEVFLLTQGTLDGCTSGLLLHIAASKLLIDFSTDCRAAEDSMVKLGALYLAVSLGAGFMAYIGMYL